MFITIKIRRHYFLSDPFQLIVHPIEKCRCKGQLLTGKHSYTGRENSY